MIDKRHLKYGQVQLQCFLPPEESHCLTCDKELKDYKGRWILKQKYCSGSCHRIDKYKEAK